MNKLEILKPALQARDEEILGYQVNIDNYRLAIAKIHTELAANSTMMEFADHLQMLLDQHITEQLKAKVMRDVIAAQVNELEAEQ